MQVRATCEPDVALTIEVADNGPGLDAAAIDQLFEPFHTTRADGSGLGLSIAREIVEAHGGTLTVVPPDDAAPGWPGATFRMELPWPAS